MWWSWQINWRAAQTGLRAACSFSYTCLTIVFWHGTTILTCHYLLVSRNKFQIYGGQDTNTQLQKQQINMKHLTLPGKKVFTLQ